MFAIRSYAEIGRICRLHGTYFCAGSGSGIKTIYINTLTRPIGVSAYKKVGILGKTGKRTNEKQEKKIPAHGKSFNSGLM
jgi:hypothetical protein